MTLRLLFVFSALAAVTPIRAQETSTTVLSGRIVVAGSSVPLPYVSVSLNGRSAQFTDSAGRFSVEGIAAGDVKLRARRIGYAPAEQTVRISRGDTVRVTLAMTRLAIQLPPMKAVARVCTNPGAPGRDADPGLVQLYDQMQQNAETLRLLSVAYPYVYVSERQFVTTLNDSVIERTPMESLTGTSARSWQYEPGKMVFERNSTTNMHLPTLATFAEASFAKAHCFDYGGVSEVDGETLVRIDFTPDARIREPDVGGSIYLDPKTYQIKRSDVVLSKVPYALSGQMTGHSVTTYFAEIAPGIPIIGGFRAVVNKLRDGEVVAELQRVTDVHFTGARPD